ncbi:MAG: GSCFA domain-containing protein [Melioribacteraceae bacterium]|nr:GSCFA domain-containing protein [Melioribacteraceae bacterium]
MKFRTEIKIDKPQYSIEHSDKVLTIGSCFAENIAEYFKATRFNILGNPFGVLYNPISIYNSLKFTVDEKKFSESDLIKHQSEWHSFYHHSDFSNHDKEAVIDNINASIKSTNLFLKSADIIILTFGTSYVFEHLEKKIVVSNCHKIPQKEFSHFRLTLSKTIDTIQKTLQLIKSVNPKVRFILTVSPVRHWKDGAINNQLSKANLLLAINEVVNSENNSLYFPSYEIVMDDLRDYRFYNSDLIHPNKLATDYIWEKFTTSFCSDKCLMIMKEVSKIVSGRNHKVRNIKSDEHQKFAALMINKIEMLHNKYIHLNLNDDLDYFKSQIERVVKRKS